MGLRVVRDEGYGEAVENSRREFEGGLSGWRATPAGVLEIGKFAES